MAIQQLWRQFTEKLTDDGHGTATAVSTVKSVLVHRYQHFDKRLSDIRESKEARVEKARCKANRLKLKALENRLTQDALARIRNAGF